MICTVQVLWFVFASHHHPTHLPRNFYSERKLFHVLIRNTEELFQPMRYSIFLAEQKKLSRFSFECHNTAIRFNCDFFCKIIINSTYSVEKSFSPISIVKSVPQKVILRPCDSGIRIANVSDSFGQINWDFFTDTLEHIS